MDSVGNAFMYSMNWNPSYIYSKFPERYTQESLSAYWKMMLKKVEPEEKTIPHFKDIFISESKVSQAKKAINAFAPDKSLLQNFNVENVTIKADSTCESNYAVKWTWKNVEINTKDQNGVSLKKSAHVNL